MALVLKDRVRETTTVLGTNDAVLLGAVTGFQSFAVVGSANTCYYCIADQAGANWEVGIGTYSSVGPTLARTTILSSSNSGSIVSFPAGTKDVFLTYPSEKAAYLDANGNLNIYSDGELRLNDSSGGEYVALKSPSSLAASYTLTMPVDDGTNGQALITDGAGNLSWSTSASGDVYGPASATDNAVTRFDGTTGKLIQNSGVIIDDSNNVTGVANLTASGSITLSGGTANGVAYLNGSKVLTTGSAFVFDGTNVGIGTSSPSSYGRLAVSGNAIAAVGDENYFAIYNTAGTRYGFLQGTAGALVLASDTGSSNTISFSVNSQVAGIFNSSKYFGFGNQSAATIKYGSQFFGNLDQTTGNLTDAGNRDSIFALFSNNSALGSGAAIVFGNNQAYAANSLGFAAIKGMLESGSGNTSGHIVFSTRASTTDTALTQRMTILSSGFVGINNASPSAKLDIQSAADGSDSVRIRSAKANAVDGLYGSITFSSGPATTFDAYGAQIASGSVYLDSGDLRFYTSSGSPGRVERMRITTGGNVGIGTGAPTQLLTVTGAGASIRINDPDFSWYYITAQDATDILSIGGSGVNPPTVGAININSAASVGIGTYPSSWSGVTAIELQGVGVYACNGTAVNFSTNGYYSGGWKFKGTGRATNYVMSVGQHEWYTSTTSGSANGAITFATAMLLNTAGNLGVSTTPSPWQTNLYFVEVGPYTALGCGGGDSLFINNAYFNTSSQFIYKTSSYASYYQQYQGQHKWFTAPSGTAGNPATMTQRLAIDNSGNVIVTNTSGLGGSPTSTLMAPAAMVGGNSNEYGSYYAHQRTNYAGSGTSYSLVAKLPVSDSGTHDHVRLRVTYCAGWASTAVGYADVLLGNRNGFSYYWTYDRTANSGMGVVAYSQVDGSTNIYAQVNDGYNVITVEVIESVQTILYPQAWTATAPTGTKVFSTLEPLTYRPTFSIDPNQSIVGGVGILSTTSGASGSTWFFGSQSNGTSFTVFNTSSVGVYIANGATSWTANSDERNKDIIEPIANASEKVSQLRAVIGKYKSDDEGVRRSFLIAQDVEKVLPEAVESSNPDNLGVQYTDVVPLLVAALKEHREEIQQLKAEIAALKGA